MQFVLLALFSILWKLAVLPVILGLVAKGLRRRLVARARARSPHAWRIEARARAVDPARDRLWHLRGMGVLVMDAAGLWWSQLRPAGALALPHAAIHEVFAVGHGPGSLLRIETVDGDVHVWRVPDAEAWAEELRGRGGPPPPRATGAVGAVPVVSGA